MEQHVTRWRGRELSYATAGDGPPIVLIPGHTMSAERWLEAGYVDDLAVDHRVVALDPLGHGESALSDDPEDYGRDALVEHVLAALDAADVSTAHVWGYSRGATMGLLLSERHPSRVSSLVFGGNVLFDAAPILAALDMVPSAETLARNHERALAGDWSGYWDTFPIPIPDATKRSIESRNHLPSISASGLAARRDSIVFETPQVPTLAYWGVDEIFHQMNIETAEPLQIETATVPGGHAEAFDPAGAALAAVRPFLERVG